MLNDVIYFYATVSYVQGVPFLKLHQNISSAKHFQKKCFRQKLFGSKENIRWYH